MDLHTAIGLAGVVAYVASYAALQLGFLDGNGATYSAANVLAASLVLFSLTRDFNLASAVTQVIWIVIGVSGLVLRVVRRRQAPVAASTDTRVTSDALPGSVRATLDLLPDSARPTGRPSLGLQADVRTQR